MDSLATLITIILGFGTGLGILAKSWVNRLLPAEKQILAASAENGEVRLLESDWSGNWISAYRDYVNGKSGFATHHGVKGRQFPRVLVIADDDT